MSTLDEEIQAFTRNEPRTIPFQIDPHIRRQMPEWAYQQALESHAKVQQAQAWQKPWGIGLEFRPGLAVGDEPNVLFYLSDQTSPFRWGAILGDVVHCLRAALDNIAWDATLMEQATKGLSPPSTYPFAPRDPWGDIYFPVFDTEGGWLAAKKKNLWGIGPLIEAIFEEYQPYKRGKPTPQNSALHILHKLSNIDKHMGVNFLAVEAQVHPVQMPAGMLFTPKTTWKLEPHANVGSVRLLTQEAVETYRKQMNMQFSVTFEVALGKGSPGEGRPIWELISEIRNEVRGIAQLCRVRRPRITG
jgi:hypothetical protein